MKSIMSWVQHRLARVFPIWLAAVVTLMISHGTAAAGAKSFDGYLGEVRSTAILSGV